MDEPNFQSLFESVPGLLFPLADNENRTLKRCPGRNAYGKEEWCSCGVGDAGEIARELGFTRFVDNLDIKNHYIRITHLIGCLRLFSQNALKERTYPCFVN